MSTFLKAAGVPKLFSNCFKGFRKPLVQSQKSLKTSSTRINWFLKATGVNKFHEFFMKIPAAFGNLLMWY